jgi:hypothetical protein
MNNWEAPNTPSRDSFDSRSGRGFGKSRHFGRSVLPQFHLLATRSSSILREGIPPLNPWERLCIHEDIDFLPTSGFFRVRTANGLAGERRQATPTDAGGLRTLGLAGILDHNHRLHSIRTRYRRRYRKRLVRWWASLHGFEAPGRFRSETLGFRGSGTDSRIHRRSTPRGLCFGTPTTSVEVSAVE